MPDYRKLPDVIEHPDTVIKDGDRTLVFLKRDGKIFHAVLKTTQSGDGLFVTSYRITNKQDVARAKKTGEIIKDGI
ncbi:MAG: hypothetical protein P4L55_11200 [Syntrophobacteraceae bacterium]|nr:hypothetical protein [Syntrophobacteraceae bacterium]